MKHRAAIRSVLLLGVLLSFTWLSRWLTEGISPRELFAPTGDPVRTPDPGLVGTAGSVGLFMLGAWIVSRLLKPIGLPAVTAYLLFGIAALLATAAAIMLPSERTVTPAVSQSA